MQTQRLILFLFGLICLTNCNNKSADTDKRVTSNTVHVDQLNNTRIDIEQIIFGIYCGECSNHCATMYRYSMTGNQNSFSADYTDSYFKNKSKLVFETYLNDKAHFDIGSEIVSQIPRKLLETSRPTERYGCPDCADGCGIYFEITRDDKKQEFYIDYQTSQLTSDIKEFAEFLKTEINKVEKLNNIQIE